MSQYFPDNQFMTLQNSLMGKISIQSIREINGFNVTQYKKFIAVVSESIANLMKVEFGVVSKRNIHNYLKAIKILPFPATYLCKTRFSSYTSTKT